MKLEIADIQKAEVFKGVVDRNIFTWDDVTKLLNTKIFNWIQLIQNNDKIGIPQISTYWEGPHLDRKFINKKINEGAGIILLRLSSYNESLAKISKSIEDSLSKSHTDAWSVDTHCYCGLEAGKESFKIHTDSTANFIMQLDGVSKWTVYKERSNGNRLNGKVKTLTSDDKLTKDIQVDLHPGDVLYIPQNAFHYCLPQTKRLSLSFAAQPGIKNEPERRTYYKYG